MTALGAVVRCQTECQAKVLTQSMKDFIKCILSHVLFTQRRQHSHQGFCREKVLLQFPVQYMPACPAVVFYYKSTIQSAEARLPVGGSF